VAEGGPSAILFGLSCPNRVPQNASLCIGIKCPHINSASVGGVETCGCIPNSEGGAHDKDIDRESHHDPRRRRDDRNPWLERARSGGRTNNALTDRVSNTITISVTFAVTITHNGAERLGDGFTHRLGQRCTAACRGAADRRTTR
jgi:hypothetical protein